MFKYYIINQLTADVWDYIMDPEHRCTLVQPVGQTQLLVIHDAPGMPSFSEPAELALEGLITETDQPE
jgi:hypothetical protein